MALGAQFCSAYFTSVLYAELWCYHKLEEKKYDSKRARSILETVCENEPFELRLRFENMLREAYKKIGDTDAIHGCGMSYILDTRSRIDYYKNTGHWDKVLLYHNKQLTPATTSADLVTALRNTGLHNLAFSTPAPADVSGAKYECAWRLRNWDWSEGADKTTKDSYFEACHYAALRALHERDYTSVQEAIVGARMRVINGLAHASLESSKSLYAPLTQLKMLQDVESYVRARREQTPEDLVALFAEWVRGRLDQNDFEYVEPVGSQRVTLLMDFTAGNENDGRSYLVDLYLKIAGMYTKKIVKKKSLKN